MKLDDVKKLHQKKYRNQFKHYLVEGEHLVLELVKANLSSMSDITLYVTAEYLSWAQALNPSFELVEVTQKQMSQLSDTQSPQGIIACVPMPAKPQEIEVTGGGMFTYTKCKTQEI